MVVVGFYFQGGNVVINSLQIDNFSKIQKSKSSDELRREADKYLNKITILQDELHTEEGNLMKFLRTHGVEVLNSDRLAL